MAGLDLFTLHMKKLIPVFAIVLLSLGFTASAFAQADTAAFKPHGSLNGQLFADYYYMLSADTVAGVPTHGAYYEPNKNISPNWGTRFFQAFDLRRVQIGYNYYFTKNITSKFLLEGESGAATGGDVLASGKRGMYIKEASVSFANAIPMGTLIFGQQAANLFSVDEGLMGYRFVEKSLLDFRGMSEAGSNDLGIQLVGNFDKEKNFGYSAFISNGMGAKDETDKYKDFSGEVNANLLDKHIVIDLSGDYMDKATVSKITDVVGTDTTRATNVAQSNSLLKIAAAYQSAPITVGLVYAMHTLAGQSLSVAGTDAVQNGISIFAHGAIIPKSLNVFARYDIYNPDTKANDNSSGRKENFLLAGLDWIPDADAPNAHIAPNIWINTFSDKSSAGTSYEPITALRLTFSDKF